MVNAKEMENGKFLELLNRELETGNSAVISKCVAIAYNVKRGWSSEEELEDLIDELHTADTRPWENEEAEWN